MDEAVGVQNNSNHCLGQNCTGFLDYPSNCPISLGLSAPSFLRVRERAAKPQAHSAVVTTKGEMYKSYKKIKHDLRFSLQHVGSQGKGNKRDLDGHANEWMDL